MSSEPGANDTSIPPPKPEEAASEHLNIKVTDGNNEVFFKIKRTTQLKKLMDAFCDRQGKAPNSVRFLFDGTRVQGGDSPESVSPPFIFLCLSSHLFFDAWFLRESERAGGSENVSRWTVVGFEANFGFARPIISSFLIRVAMNRVSFARSPRVFPFFPTTPRSIAADPDCEPLASLPNKQH